VIAAPQAVDAAGPMDAQTRPQILAKPRRRGFAQAPTALIYLLDPKTGTDSPDETDRAGTVRTWSTTCRRRERTLSQMHSRLPLALRRVRRRFLTGRIRDK